MSVAATPTTCHTDNAIPGLLSAEHVMSHVHNLCLGASTAPKEHRTADVR